MVKIYQMQKVIDLSTKNTQCTKQCSECTKQSVVIIELNLLKI